MKYYIGIDIGAVSIKAGCIAINGDSSSLTRVGFTHLTRSALPLIGEDSADIYIGHYQRTLGHPIKATTEVLEQIIQAVGHENIAGVCFTGSAASLAAEKLRADTINEFKAVALGLSVMGIPARTVLEMGGQRSKYILLDKMADGFYSIADYSTNGDCAAGTGAFIDQQAGRLKFSVEDVGEVALSAERSAQIAGRCSVFAKSDMIHAQQKGYSPAEVLSGLCKAVARNFKMAVVRSHPVEPPVIFIGGVAANKAVVSAMREVFNLSDADFSAPTGYAHVLAIGAAVQACKNFTGTAQWHIADQMDTLRATSDTARGRFPRAKPLSMERVVLLRDRIVPYELPYGKKIDAFLGIDIGSVSTNLAVIDMQGDVVYEIYTRTQGRPIEVVSEALKKVEEAVGDRIIIRGVGTTGSGRELIGQLVGADTINDEITAHKTGATLIGEKMLDGKVPDTIFEIGGQDSKYISIQDGVVVDFTMNDACAAGTGSFLEERAEELGISIINEFAEIALSSKAPIRLGERCTVFMERDVSNYLQRGADKADLVAGLAYSVVHNYINRVVRGRRIGDCIFFQGGTAYNDAVAAAMASVLNKEIIVPPHNGVMGAIGAALLARDKMLALAMQGKATSEGQIASPVSQQGNGDGNGQYIPETDNLERKKISFPPTRFRGYDLSNVNYSLREFICNGCSNHCTIQEFTVEGEKTYWGDKCSDRYRKARKTTKEPVIEDLFVLRKKLFEDDSDLPPVPDDAATIGIPRAMFAMDYLPFWRTFWTHCGFKVIVSPPTNQKIITDGVSHVVAEPCFPVIVAHGHVAHLLQEGVDYVFVPNTVSADTRIGSEAYICPWGQTLPFVLRRVPAFEAHYERFLTPCVRFREGFDAVAKVLRKLCSRLGVKRRTVDKALIAAYERQRRFRSQLIEAGNKAIDTLNRTNQMGVVIIGRPYNIHDAGVNLNVPGKLRSYYGVNCIPIDCLDTDSVDISDVNDNMFWEYGRRLIAAAKIVGRHENLHIIHITNFKCGPDSFIRHFIRYASGKPFLALQFDGHSNDAGIMTRCEAYLDSKGIIRPWRRVKLTDKDRMVSVGR
ncbi:MAG: hypothetical protein J7L99_00790 [Planctomycetes bacterium]|nr:hypothetical protein [Planctomycetota bacterium]